MPAKVAAGSSIWSDASMRADGAPPDSKRLPARRSHRLHGFQNCSTPAWMNDIQNRRQAA
jgi:hypothetical protein